MSFQDPSFVGDSQQFLTKRTNLFAVLDQAEKDLESKIKKTAAADARHILYPGDRTARIKSGRSLTRQFRGKDSLFVKPEIPPWRIIAKHKAPDFKLHPHKWTKYSLADVHEMNDKSNAAAAFTFLREMQTRKCHNDVGDAGEESKKIVFKRSVIKSDERPGEPDTKAIFKSSKLIMPEYEFGKKVPKKRNPADSNKPEETPSINRQIKLGHLMEDETDE